MQNPAALKLLHDFFWREVVFLVLQSCRTHQIRMTERLSELFTSNTAGILLSFQ